ncbi:MAG: hypothetical protein KH347_05445 [Acetobacter sp.]|nr:hypothetical protein [Acetobacter sp.]
MRHLLLYHAVPDGQPHVPFEHTFPPSQVTFAHGSTLLHPPLPSASCPAGQAHCSPALQLTHFLQTDAPE